tara:strand:- start:201 stop:1388 length:1188 start_codon:yes stop_codon:yes gene_type:complete
MGRQTLGNTNVNFSGDMYPSCYRTMSGRANTNLSLNGWTKYNESISTTNPAVIGTATGNTNFSIGTYAKGRGYNWFISVKNSPNGTLNVGWPTESTYADKGNSSANSSATIMEKYMTISASTSYWTLTQFTNSGYQFDGYYTAPSGGTLVSSSSSFNLYYTNSNLISQAKLYVQRSAAGTPTSPGYSIQFNYNSGNSACNTFTRQTVYFTPTNATTIFNATKMYNLGGNSFSPGGYYSENFGYRLWHQGGFWSGGPGFCGGKCFMKGSRVLMGDDTLKPIENVKIGNKVKTKEGDTVLVEDTFIYNTKSIKKIYSKDKLKITHNHPVYVNNKWLTAEELNWDSEFMFVDKLYNLKTENNFIIEGISASGTTHEYLDVITDSNGYNKILGKKVINK